MRNHPQYDPPIVSKPRSGPQPKPLGLPSGFSSNQGLEPSAPVPANPRNVKSPLQSQWHRPPWTRWPTPRHASSGFIEKSERTAPPLFSGYLGAIRSGWDELRGIPLIESLVMFIGVIPFLLPCPSNQQEQGRVWVARPCVGDSGSCKSGSYSGSCRWTIPIAPMGVYFFISWTPQNCGGPIGLHLKQARHTQMEEGSALWGFTPADYIFRWFRIESHSHVFLFGTWPKYPPLFISPSKSLYTLWLSIVGIPIEHHSNLRHIHIPSESQMPVHEQYGRNQTPFSMAAVARPLQKASHLCGFG